MTVMVMVAEVYDALKEAGASEEKARKAAEVLAGFEGRFSAIQTRLAVLMVRGCTRINPLLHQGSSDEPP